MIKRKRKLREAEEELVVVAESEEVTNALDDLKEALINADKLNIEEDEEMTFQEAIEDIKEAIEGLDVDNKEAVVEALEKMEEDECKMTEEEIKDFAENCDKLQEEIENLEEEDDEKSEVNESDEDEVNEEDEKELNEDEEEVNEEDEEKSEVNESDEDEVNEEDEKETLDESVNRIFKKMKLNESTKFAIKTLIESKIKEEEEEMVEELNAKCEEYAEELRKEAEEKLAEEIEDLNKKADSYLSHVAEEWAEDNKLAIKEGIKTQIAENIMKGLRKLLEENNIDIKEEDEDMVEQAVEKCEQLQDKLDEVLADKLELQEQVKQLTKYKLVQENTRDLTQVQRDRLSKLLENANYSSKDELLNKIKVLKENYILQSKAEVVSEQVNKKAAKSNLNEIDAYASFIQRSGN